jgi:PKD repeat protein
VRAFVIVLMVLCLAGNLPAADLAIQPTTTLTAETANNTAAADSFATQTNGNPAGSNISKLPVRSLLYPGAGTKIYAHFMPWFGGANHMWVGYRSDDRLQVRKQVTDMMSRGYDGAIVDWYGPEHARENSTTLYLRDEAETRAGLFSFAVMEDVGSLNSCANTAGCDVTQKLINDLNYAAATYYPSPAYMRIGGRPVMFFFGVDKYVIDWSRARAGANGNPLFVFRQASAFTHAQTDGGFSWVGISTESSNMGLGYLDDFYSTALKYPTKQTFGSAYPGFNNTLAAWVSSPPKIVDRQCGATWMASLAEAGKYYSASKQLPWMQMVTWNDYEEGSELESGVDSCASVAASVGGATLSWTLSGSPAVVDHYNVFLSLDGENLMKLTSLDSAQRSLDLAGFGLAPGNYVLHVQAYAKPSLRNAMSNAVSYTLANLPPAVTLALDRSSGVAPETVAATVTATDADGAVAATTIDFGDGSAPARGATASHQYPAAGSYLVRATVTDDRGATASATGAVTIAANQAPAAALALSPGSGVAPLAVTASGSGSSDSDGAIVSSTIDFGDGTVAAGPTASHTYSSAGSKTVRVTVTDDKGATSEATGTVSVTAAAVTISTPLEGSALAAPLRVVASGSSASEVWLTQVYLDGQKVTEVAGAAIDATLSPAPGAHRIAVQCYDRAGNLFKSAVNVTVVNQPPIAALAVTPQLGTAPVTVTASTAASTDADGSIASSTIDFGDGTVVAGPDASHTYSSAGTRTVTAIVTDDRGASAQASTTITVNPSNQPPVARLSVSPTSGLAALTVAASAAGSSDADGAIVATQLDFGDGFVANAASASHLYSKVGSYTVKATVTDDAGATTTTSQVVTAQPGVKLTSPAPSWTSRSVLIAASAASASPITLMRVYVDNVNVYSTAAATLRTSRTMRRGTHTIMVQAWDAAGMTYKSSVQITVK